MAEVELSQVSKIYRGEVQAVRDLSLRVAPGEQLVLVGPSGSGKTTTLRLIAGLETPTAGTLRIGGRPVTDVPPHERNMAMVFQRPVVYPHLTVVRNLLFGLELAGRSVPDQDERIREAASLLGLESILDRRADQLSVGQQQRVSLGRALVRRPAVLLLDEPLSHLDRPLRAELRKQLHLLHSRLAATMIHVTHDPAEAMLADRVAVLDQGALLQVDAPQVVHDRPANRRVAGFFGCPAMNLVDGRLETTENGGLGLRLGSACLPIAGSGSWRRYVGAPVTVGIRPERLALGAADGLEMENTLVESLGEDLLVTLRYAEFEVTARVARPLDCRLGEKVKVIMPLLHAHLFDRATGLALGHGEASG